MHNNSNLIEILKQKCEKSRIQHTQPKTISPQKQNWFIFAYNNHKKTQYGCAI